MEEMEQACMDTIKANDHLFKSTDEHRLMINVSRGPLSIYAPIFGGKMEPTVVIADFPLKWTVASMGNLYDTGINAVIPSQRAIPADLLDPKIKNRSRIHYQMANIEVSECAGDNNWALLLDTDGFIAKGTGDNFFIVKDGEVITPEGRNILRGISRDYIFDICKSNNMKCIEKNINAYDVYTADEAFMTGTPFCILPVSSLNGIKIGTNVFGKITHMLLDTWGHRVGVDIIKQIKEFSLEVKSTPGSTPYSFKK
jgi:branched-chain amino acid aminotransferase